MSRGFYNSDSDLPEKATHARFIGLSRAKSGQIKGDIFS